MSIRPRTSEENLQKIRGIITNYRNNNKLDAQLIENIKKNLFDSRRKDNADIKGMAGEAFTSILYNARFTRAKVAA